MKLAGFLLPVLLGTPCAAGGVALPTVVFQPSHQTDTGENYNEAETCGAIVDYALREPPFYQERKVWSYNQGGLHHAREGTNTKIEHTTALQDGKLSGYAWELAQSNAQAPEFFIAVHNNGGTGRHALWGYIHDGDAMEAANRRFSNILIEEIARATDLENRGTHLDSSAGRNDHRCAVTGRQSFYSIDENVNKAPYRVILEIGDSEASRAFLLDEGRRRAIGAAIKRGLERFLKTL
ncbi:MAG TPA: hypothetical protein PKI19_12090 [Elusimicrobiales bacterium]|nr:hypothetical protein [Elusimicrobiales bacterium]